MKKILLSLVCLLSFGSIAMADDIKSLEPTTEYTTIEELQTAGTFAIVNKAEGKVMYGPDAQNMAYDTYTNGFKSTVSGYEWRLVEDGNGNYMFQLVKPNGDDYGPWGGTVGLLNSQGATGWCSFILGKDQDIPNGSSFQIEYSSVEGGWSIKNVGTELYKGFNGGTCNASTPSYWQFCKVEEVIIPNPIAKGTYDATDAKIFRQSGEATSNVTLSWTEGIDLGAYQYIVINMGQNTMENGSTGEISIKDGNGITIKGDGYGEAYQNLWFGTWNHQYTCCIDLEKLRTEQQFNLHDIRELNIPVSAPVIMNTIYATNAKANTVNRWSNPNDEGTYRILEDKLEAGKFGTVCLPYKASYSGVSIYQIASASTDYITLEEVTGLMESGKAYFYQVNEPLNPTHADTKIRAFFYKAETADEAVAPVANNGLIGTFADNGNVPNNAYILSGNKLYKVDSEVPFAANKAYLDLTAVINKGSEAKTVDIDIDAEATAIETLNALTTGNVEAIYGANGAKQNGLQKGVNLVKMSNGTVKKVMVK